MRCRLSAVAGMALVLLAQSAAFADWTPPAECEVDLDREEAFPGAYGFGSTTPGGRCGAVYVVSLLSDDGKQGELRWALEEQTGPRTIVFQTGGEIELNDTIWLTGEEDSHLTIAGETAPGGGILITEFGIHLNDVHDVIIRNLRLRNIQKMVRTDAPDSLGDGIEMNKVDRVIVDRASVSWATDEGIGPDHSEPVGSRPVPVRGGGHRSIL